MGWSWKNLLGGGDGDKKEKCSHRAGMPKGGALTAISKLSFPPTDPMLIIDMGIEARDRFLLDVREHLGFMENNGVMENTKFYIGFEEKHSLENVGITDETTNDDKNRNTRIHILISHGEDGEQNSQAYRYSISFSPNPLNEDCFPDYDKVISCRQECKLGSNTNFNYKEASTKYFSYDVPHLENNFGLLGFFLLEILTRMHKDDLKNYTRLIDQQEVEVYQAMPYYMK